MTRMIAIGLAALALAACKPVAAPAAPAAPAQPATPVAPAAVADPSVDAAWETEANRYLAVNVQPSDPVDALMWRGVRCDFLAGEFGGDNSAQDRAVNARMDELRCGDELLAEARAVRGTLAGDPAAVTRLDALIARYEG